MSAIESTNVVTANLERMAFAHARGARFQSRNRYGNWVNKSSVFIPIRGDRLHPDDDHLQYGPLSSALREAAVSGDWDGMAFDALDVAEELLPGLFDAPYRGLVPWVVQGDYHNLIAEFLADEGL